MEMILDKIQSILHSGGFVLVTTHLRATQFDKPKHADMFKVGKDGDLYMARGRAWDCIGTARCGLLVGLRMGWFMDKKGNKIK